MPDKDLGIAGMFEKQEKQELVIVKHDERLDNHDLVLQKYGTDIEQLKANNIRLENVVMSENRVTRETITQTNKELHDLIKNLLGYKTGEQQQQVQMSQISTNLTLAKYESWAKIIGILGGSGGFLYWLFGVQ